MAILREGITLGNEYIGQMRMMSKELANMGEEIISYLNGNANFQTFREGTPRGAAIYNDLNKCIDTIMNQLVPTVDKITVATENLLNQQQNLNRAEDRRMY